MNDTMIRVELDRRAVGILCFLLIILVSLLAFSSSQYCDWRIQQITGVQMDVLGEKYGVHNAAG